MFSIALMDGEIVEIDGRICFCAKTYEAIQGSFCCMFDKQYTVQISFDMQSRDLCGYCIPSSGFDGCPDEAPVETPVVDKLKEGECAFQGVHGEDKVIPHISDAKGQPPNSVETSRLGFDEDLNGSAVNLFLFGNGDRKVVVGLNAVEKLLVLDDFLKKNPDVSGLLDKVEKSRGGVFIFESSSEPGKRLSALGGLVAILRYKIA